MKKLCLIFFWAFVAHAAYAQIDSIYHSIEWRLYSVNDHAGLEYPIDSLQKCTFIELSRDSVSSYLNRLIAVYPASGVAWMGGYFATCKINTQLRKIYISAYGGFLYDEHAKRYYQLPLAIRKQWLLFVNTSFKKIIRN